MTQTKQSQKKNPDTSGLFKQTDYNVKITKIESKTPSNSGLATNAALTNTYQVFIKIPNISSLAKKQIITEKLVSLIIIMINILQCQSLILQLLMILMQDQHK